MATQTTNYGLRKPATNDYVNVQTDLNDNYDIIDSTMKALSDDIDAAEADIEQNAEDIATMDAAITSITTTYTYTVTDSTTGITINARKCGGILQVQLSGSVTLASHTWTVIGTLPTNCRPAVNEPYATLVCQNSTTTAKMLLSVYSNGQVRVNASAGAISGVYFNDMATFVAD